MNINNNTSIINKFKQLFVSSNNSKYIILHDYCYYNGFRGYSIPESDKEWALSIDKNSFFYEKYSIINFL